MGRYNNINVINNNGKRYYSTVLYPDINKLESDIYIISNMSTRLDVLAYNYYNDSSLYWIIAVCNDIYGTIFVEPGKQICIPNPNRINDIISEYNYINRHNNN